nr:GNAT family protein [Burkholderia sp. ABCPW 14]
MNAFRPPELIETERLRMRPLVDDDAHEAFDALFGDPVTTLDLPWPMHRSVDESRASIRRLADGWRSGTFFSWGLFEKRDGCLIGTLEMHGCPPRVEIGLLTSFAPGRVRTRAWSEMLRKILGWLIAQPGVYRIEAFCSVTGKAAPFMPRLGFVCEGAVRNYEARPNRGMSAGDSYLFAITKASRALGEVVEAGGERASSRRAA